MTKKSRLNMSLALIIAIAVFLSICPVEANAASNYSDTELVRFVDLGIGTYKSKDPQITYAQFMKMLDHMVGLADRSSLTKWSKQLPKVSHLPPERLKRGRNIRYNLRMSIQLLGLCTN